LAVVGIRIVVADGGRALADEVLGIVAKADDAVLR
jgi:hypothetical protein